MKTPTLLIRSLVLLLVATWALLYLPHLRTSPPWYGDETLIHHTSRNLASGIASNMALHNTFWHPHYPYQPAYTLANGLFAKAAAGDILGSRFFNALLALSCTLAILLIGRHTLGLLASAFAATMFLCYQQSIIHFRMSYAHNGAGLGILLMTLFLMRKPSPRNDWPAGLGLAIAAGSHPLFIHGALAGTLSRIKHPRSWLPLLTPSALYLAVSLSLIYLTFGQFLIEDLIHLKNSYLTRGDTDGAGWQALRNFLLFIFQDPFHTLACLGLLLGALRGRWIPALIGFLVLFLLVRNRQNLIPFYYQAVVILPVLCLGWAGLWNFSRHLIRYAAPRLRSAHYLLAALPIILFAHSLPKTLTGTLQPRNHYWVTQSTREVEAAAAWLNARLQPGSSVGGNPNIAWLLRAETTPYLQMITWYGFPTQGYENGNPRERFRYDASLESAQFAIIGDIDQRWTFGEPNVHLILKKIQSENWPVVWRGEYYLIFFNPRFHPSP